MEGEKPKFVILPGGAQGHERNPQDISETPEGQAVRIEASVIFTEALSKAGSGIEMFRDGSSSLDHGDWVVIPLDKT